MLLWRPIDVDGPFRKYAALLEPWLVNSPKIKLPVETARPHFSGHLPVSRIDGSVGPVDQKPPTAVIESAHQNRRMALDDTADFADADRGFIGALTPCVVKAADGRVVWDNDAYSFITGEAPPSVDPSLWRQCMLTAKQGLY